MDTKYIINFKEELEKMLNEETTEESNMCQISGNKLDNNFVTMECGHKFNYKPLFKEICNQKYKYHSYKWELLSQSDVKMLNESDKNYYIKCPYCRHIQTTLLPSYEDMNVQLVFGVNSDDIKKTNTYDGIVYENIPGYVLSNAPNIEKKCNVKFEDKGGCQYVNGLKDLCLCKKTATIPETDMVFCIKHYAATMAQKIKEEKEKKREEMKQKKLEKEKLAQLKKETLEKINNERVKKGLPPLKRLSAKYLTNDINVNTDSDTNTNSNNVCEAILKTGKNKGTKCGRKLHTPEALSKHLCVTHLHWCHNTTK